MQTRNAIPAFGFRTASDIRFGRGEAERCLPDIAALASRVLLVRGRSVAFADRAEAALTQAGIGVCTVTARGEPDIAAVEAACAAARKSDAGAVVSIGGGSVIDLGKAVAAILPASGAVLDYLEGVGAGKTLPAAALPFVALPSTAGTGAEATKNAVIAVPEAGRKVSLRDPRMLPDLAVVDPGLTDDSPRGVTFASGLDAVTQVIEPFLCARTNPLTDALCAHAIPLGLQALARLAETECARARDEMAFVSLCGGMALANAGLGAVHGLAGVIGGRTGAPHGLICGRLLGPVLHENGLVMAAQDQDTSRLSLVCDWISQVFGMPRGGFLEGWSALLDDLGVAPLAAWMPDASELTAIAQEAASASSMKANPVALPRDSLIRIMQAA